MRTGGTMTIQGNAGSPQGVSRRELLRRGAVVGGALAWTTPAVQVFSSPAAASTPTILFYRVQFSWTGTAWQEVTPTNSTQTTPCEPERWRDAQTANAASASAAGVSIEDEDDPGSVTIQQSGGSLSCTGLRGAAGACLDAITSAENDCASDGSTCSSGDPRISITLTPPGVGCAYVAGTDTGGLRIIRVTVCCPGIAGG